MTQPIQPPALNMEDNIIPHGASNRPGNHITVTYITIHDTDNYDDGADARANARYMLGADARARQVSWHYTVDDHRCVRSLPDNEEGWHTASHLGNMSSIGIETCVNAGIDHDAANDRAAYLAAQLAKSHGVPIQNVVQHHHWISQTYPTGKDCPRYIRQTWPGGWERFIGQVTQYLQVLEV